LGQPSAGAEEVVGETLEVDGSECCVTVDHRRTRLQGEVGAGALGEAVQKFAECIGLPVHRRFGLPLECGDATGEVGRVVGQVAQRPFDLPESLAIVRVRRSAESEVPIRSCREPGDAVAHMVGALGETA
jgi:hypothetical protein